MRMRSSCGSFSFFDMSRRSQCLIDGVTNFTSVAQRGGFHVIVVGYFACRHPLFLNIVRASSWIIKSSPPVSGMSRLPNMAC